MIRFLYISIDPPRYICPVKGTALDFGFGVLLVNPRTCLRKTPTMARPNVAPWGKLIQAAFFESNLSGKLYGSFTENSEDPIFGDKSDPYKELNKFLWGATFKED